MGDARVARTVESLRSEKATPCSMYGTCAEVIHRSARERSIRLEVVVAKPRNSPSWTTIRTTAKTTPVTVTSSRTLSCTRLRQASSDSFNLMVISFAFTPSFDVTLLSTVQKNFQCRRSPSIKVSTSMETTAF